MTKMLFGGAAVTSATDTDPKYGIDARHVSSSALVDRIGLDIEDATILLGPVARAFHGLPDINERVGIQTFLECYDFDARQGLVELIEELAGEGRPFHFTARLAASGAAVVHGYLAPSDGSGNWTGMLVMSRQESAMPMVDAIN